MDDRSNIPQSSFSMGKIEKTVSGWIIKDLLVRWNERQETKEIEEGEEEIEYVYDAHRFDLHLPVEVQPGREAVEYYLEQAKDAIIQLAQDNLAQEEGFSC